MKSCLHQIEFLQEQGNYIGALLTLSKFLYQKHNKKVVILIDEYDTPLITAHARKYYQEAIDFFRNFLSAGLKGNPYLEFSVLTGILRIAKESIFSGLNNLFVSTILDEEYNHFGLTESEVKKLLSDYDLTAHLADVKHWYNGYLFGTKQVYNPWSIINFASRKKLEPYWVNTSDNALIKQLLDKNDVQIQQDLQALFSGEMIEEAISSNIIFSDLEHNLDTIWSLMLFSGYLTVVKQRVSDITSIRTYFLKIPNYEVHSFFKDSFIREYSAGKTAFYFKMLENLYQGDLDAFTTKFKSLYQSSISYHESADNEKYYHHFMLGLLLTLGDKYIITSNRENRESGLGRYDIALEPIDKSNYGLIFEFKVAKSADNLVQVAKEALTQIQEKQYDEAMKQRHTKKSLKLAWHFAVKQ